MVDSAYSWGFVFVVGFFLFRSIRSLKTELFLTHFVFLAVTAVLLITGLRARAGVPADKDLSAYLLVYFLDKDHSLHFALSSDGYSFTDVNHGQPVMRGEDI